MVVGKLGTVVETIVDVVAANFHTAHLMGVGGMPNFADTTVDDIDIEVGKVAVVDMIAGAGVVEDKNVAAAEVAVAQVAAVVTSIEKIQICPG